MWLYFFLFLPLLCVGQRRLEQFNIDRNGISISGISSGGSMASQFQVIHSRTIKGAAIFAGAPYGCIEVHDAITCTSDPADINVGELLRNMDEMAGSGDIDPVSNLAGDRVFVYNGALDSVVDKGVGEKVRTFYEQIPVSLVASEFDLAAEHGFPTVDYGVPCNEIGGDYLNRCNYNGAYMALNTIYGNLTQPTTPAGEFYEFDQDDFFHISLPSASAMDTTGYIYVPSACVGRATQCRLHIALHGCLQGRETVGDVFARQAGYNEVGEANNIIILYPQAISTVIPVNPMGCWDWFGYLPLYDTKDGPQIIAFKRMIDRMVDGS